MAFEENDADDAGGVDDYEVPAAEGLDDEDATLEAGADVGGGWKATGRRRKPDGVVGGIKGRRSRQESGGRPRKATDTRGGSRTARRGGVGAQKAGAGQRKAGGSRTAVARKAVGRKKAAGGGRKAAGALKGGARKGAARKGGARKGGARKAGARKAGARKTGARKGRR